MQVAEQDSAERTPRPHLRAYRLGLGLRALGLNKFRASCVRISGHKDHRAAFQ